MMLLGLGLSFTLPYPAPLSQSPGSVAVLTPPRFREHIEEVHFSLGPSGLISTYTLAELQEQAREPFDFYGYKPVRIFEDNGNIYADFTVWGGVGQSPIKVRRNEFTVRPVGWDRNSNQNALEVVNANQVPVFQMIYKTESHIVVNGIFPTPGGLLVADEHGVRREGNLATMPLSIHRIFKYPSWKYPGQME
jgi:hypothetical protein